MRQRTKAFWVWGVMSLLTLLLYAFGDMDIYPQRGLPFIWLFCSWNFYAFGFSSDMWPFQFVELKKNGSKTQREVFFWGTAVVYLSLLAVIACAE